MHQGNILGMQERLWQLVRIGWEQKVEADKESAEGDGEPKAPTIVFHNTD